jgi:ABC-type lipoprotein release transport system permease subunit
MLASLGIVIGAAASLMATRVLRSLLFQVDARDPVTLVAVAILLMVTAMLATLIPALRATRVDPVVAMRV